MVALLEFIEQIGSHGQLSVQVEDVKIQEFLQVHARILRAKDAGMRIKAQDLVLESGQSFFADEINFVDQDKIGQSDLFPGNLGFFELGRKLLSIDNGDDRIQPRVLLELRNVQERLRNRARIGHAGRFDEDIVELIAFQQLLDAFDQIFPNGAANAAVAQFDHIFGLRFNQFPVDSGFADFVDDHSEPVIGLLFQDIIKECGFPRTEEPGEDADSDHFVRHHRIKQKRAIQHGRIALKGNAKVALHQPAFLQRLESTVLGDRLERAGSELDRHEPINFGHPDSASLKVRRENPSGIGGHVLADATFFLGHTAPMDYMTLYGFGAGDTAFSRHFEFSW